MKIILTILIHGMCGVKIMGFHFLYMWWYCNLYNCSLYYIYVSFM